MQQLLTRLRKPVGGKPTKQWKVRRQSLNSVHSTYLTYQKAKSGLKLPRMLLESRRLEAETAAACNRGVGWQKLPGPGTAYYE